MIGKIINSRGWLSVLQLNTQLITSRPQPAAIFCKRKSRFPISFRETIGKKNVSRNTMAFNLEYIIVRLVIRKLMHLADAITFSGVAKSANGNIAMNLLD